MFYCVYKPYKAILILKFLPLKRLINLKKSLNEMRKIVLDTNFLIYCAKFKIDFFSELERICNFPYKIAVLDKTLEELEKVKPKELKLIKKYLEKINIIKSKENYVDKELINLKDDCIIATQDLKLKKQLKGPVIIIRQRKYLELKN